MKRASLIRWKPILDGVEDARSTLDPPQPLGGGDPERPGPVQEGVAHVGGARYDLGVRTRGCVPREPIDVCRIPSPERVALAGCLEEMEDANHHGDGESCAGSIGSLRAFNLHPTTLRDGNDARV